MTLDAGARREHKTGVFPCPVALVISDVAPRNFLRKKMFLTKEKIKDKAESQMRAATDFGQFVHQFGEIVGTFSRAGSLNLLNELGL